MASRRTCIRRSQDFHSGDVLIGIGSFSVFFGAKGGLGKLIYSGKGAWPPFRKKSSFFRMKIAHFAT